MSKKYTIELEAKVDKATSEVEELKKEIQKLNQQVVQTNKDTADGIKNVEKATKGTTSAIRRLGASIKQLGLGILIASWQKIQELFGSNQLVLNTFNTAFEALSIIFNDFVNFVTSNFGTVVGFFKAIFQDPTTIC
jgi:TolA-binding protein